MQLDGPLERNGASGMRSIPTGHRHDGNVETTTTTETHTYNTYVHTVPMQAYEHSGLTLTFGIGVHNSMYVRMYVQVLKMYTPVTHT